MSRASKFLLLLEFCCCISLPHSLWNSVGRMSVTFSKFTQLQICVTDSWLSTSAFKCVLASLPLEHPGILWLPRRWQKPFHWADVWSCLSKRVGSRGFHSPCLTELKLGKGSLQSSKLDSYARTFRCAPATKWSSACLTWDQIILQYCFN